MSPILSFVFFVKTIRKTYVFWLFHKTLKKMFFLVYILNMDVTFAI
jgi:hypothetical protein